MIIIDQNKITVESYVGIKFISDTLIEVLCQKKLVAITGTSLVVSGLNKYEILVKGNIGGLQFHEIDA